jgi:cytochrome b
MVVDEDDSGDTSDLPRATRQDDDEYDDDFDDFDDDEDYDDFDDDEDYEDYEDDDPYDEDFKEKSIRGVEKAPLWDLPTRIFHWLLVCLIPAAWLSAEFQASQIHELVGRSVLVLVLFRVMWGIVGSRHSRFIDFLVGPRRLLAYIKGRAPAGIGHNPLGGWSVVVLLVLLFVQAFSGLFNSDDIFFSGPLYYTVEKATRDLMGATHDWAFNLLLGFIALHIGAVLYHQFKHKKKMIQAMWRGRAPGREGKSRTRSSLLALVVLAVFAALLWFGLSLAPGPPPSPWDIY